MPGKNKDTKSSSISRNLHWVTRPSASIRDLALWGADVLGAPSHITNAARDVSNRVANLPIIGLDAAYNYATGNNSTWEDAFKEADTNPSALASAFEVFPITNTESNYSDAQLANQYELRKHSPGKPGQITHDGYRYINQGRYAGDIGTGNFFSPSKVNEWSIGQTSGIADEEGNTYTSDLFAYDTKDTNDVYLKAIKEGKASPAMLLRGALGVVGAKGYDDGTNSATAIRTKIDTKAQKRAYDTQNKKAYGGSLRSSWDDLSLAEKSEMMKVAIKNGITDLSTIRQKYNEFAEGGPEETYNVGYIPEVTIEAKRTTTPYTYYDPWSRRYKGIGVGGQRIEYGEGFNPEGSILLPNAQAYENQRLIRAKQDDLNHTYDFGNKMRNIALATTVAPMAGPLWEAAQATAPLLAPGSKLWMSPVTKQLLTGTEMSEAINLATKAFTGYDTVGQGVGATVEQLTGWNPNNTLLGSLVTEAFNPGWYWNPNSVMSTVGKVGGAAERNLKGLTDSSKAFYKNLTMDLNSVPGVYYHGSPNRNINEFKPGRDGGIFFTPTKKAARGYTGNLGTGRIYEAKLDLGNNPVVIDAGGKAWSAIPEDIVAEKFGMSTEDVHNILGHYNIGSQKWYEDFLVPFGYKPKNHNYAIDQIVRLGKQTGKSSITLKNARDSGKGLFGRKSMLYDQNIVYSPNQISLLPSKLQL